MLVPFYIYSAIDGAPLAGVVPSFVSYNRLNSDASVDDLIGTPPTISDKGGGLYEFAIPDDVFEAGSIVNYVIDCTTSSAARYNEDHLISDVVLELETTTTVSTLNTFGVTSDAVRRHHYPHQPTFSTVSNPTAATVGEAIEDAASDLDGRLRLKNIDPTTIVDTAKAAYKWCAQTIRLDAAIRIYPAMTGAAPKLLDDLTKKLKARLDDLEENGATVLGLGAAASDGTEPEGPTTHITEHGLTISDASLMSTVEPPFHKDDEL